MLWTIETKRGCFEGSKIKDVIRDMVEFYGQNSQDPSQIKSLLCYYENGKERVFCEDAMLIIQELIEEGARKWGNQ